MSKQAMKSSRVTEFAELLLGFACMFAVMAVWAKRWMHLHGAAVPLRPFVVALFLIVMTVSLVASGCALLLATRLEHHERETTSSTPLDQNDD